MSTQGARTYMPAVSADLPTGERPMIAVLHAVAGHDAQLRAAIAVLAAAVRQEPGCQQFRAFRDAEDSGTFGSVGVLTATLVLGREHRGSVARSHDRHR